MLITATCQVAHPRLLGIGIDFLYHRTSPAFLPFTEMLTNFYALVGIYVGAHLLLLLGRMLWRITLARETHLAANWLREKIYQHVQFFPQEDLDRNFTTGNVMNLSTSDINAGKMIFGFTLVAACDVLFLGVFTVASMWSIDPQMAMGSFIIAPILFYGVTKLGKLEWQSHRRSQEFLSVFNENVGQAISTIKLQKITQTGKFWEKKLFTAASTFRTQRLHALFISLRYFPVLGCGVIISYLVLFLYGIGKVEAQAMTIGQFVTMQGLIFLLQDPIIELGFVVSEWQRASACLGRIAQVYNHPRDLAIQVTGDQGPEDYSTAKPLVAMKNVSFAYPHIDRLALKNFSMELYAGDRLGIIGQIGSGKTTLLKIMSGLLIGHDGAVHFAGRPFANYSHQLLRQQIALVGQKPFLFAQSIRQNLLLDQQLPDELLYHYLALVCFDQDLSQFPQGLDTQLGEWGINLSGGQKQRLCLARALIRRPRLLLLDDCFSAVDPQTEEAILQRLNVELNETAVVWVAHRRSTLKFCQRIEELG